MKDRAKFTIEAVRVDGRPMEPKKAADKFVRQAGVLVRDQIPIIIENWNKPKKGDGTFVDEVLVRDQIPIIIENWNKPKKGDGTFVDDRSKETLWNSLLVNFTLPPEEDENKPVIKEKVKEWTLKNMADAFRNWKTKLNKFVKARETPDFEDAYYAKIRPHWPEFVTYKNGSITKKR